MVKVLRDNDNYYIWLDRSDRWDSSVNASDKSDMINISAALAEYLGDIYYADYDYPDIYENDLKRAINNFNALSNKEVKRLTKIGKGKMVIS